MSNKNKAPIFADVDDMPEVEIDKRVAETLGHIHAILQLWPSMIRLTALQRRASIGRSLGVLTGPLEVLLGIIARPKGKPAPAIAQAFDVLGAQDHGQDPERFEGELIARRIHRVQAEQKVQKALADLARHFGDDVIHAGEMVVGPGMLALGLAKSLAKATPEYATALAPLFDALRAMTKGTRKHPSKS